MRLSVVSLLAVLILAVCSAVGRGQYAPPPMMMLPASPPVVTQPTITQTTFTQPAIAVPSTNVWTDAGVPFAESSVVSPGLESPVPIVGEPLPVGTTYGVPGAEPWSWQVLPDGLIYKSYLAGTKEPRLGTQIFYEKEESWLWETTLGGRVGLLRYGTTDALTPEGWQFDLEGAAFPRLDPQENMDLSVVDFRAGAPITYGCGPWRVKLAYYHLSSHVGDEQLLRTGSTTRFNYSRDAVVLGLAYFINPDVRIYGEADWAVIHRDVTEPWAFQFGWEYSPARPTGIAGAPFAAIGGHLRQEIDFSGNLVVQACWQWRGNTGHLLRMGGHYHNGPSNQFEIYNQFEQQIGMGVWYDY